MFLGKRPSPPHTHPPSPSRERIGDWGGPETDWAHLCVAERRATRPNGEWRYSIRKEGEEGGGEGEGRRERESEREREKEEGG